MRFGVSPFKVGDRVKWMQYNGIMTATVVNDHVDITGSIKVKPDRDSAGWKRVRDLESA